MAANYVFLGPPGAGKGTMAELMAERFGFVHISTGDILRFEMKRGSELGRKARSFVDSGQLVSDDVVAAIVSEKLGESDVQENGCVLDGYPRTVKQAELLDAAFEKLPSALAAVLLLDVSRPLLVKRLTARRLCSECGAVHNLEYNPPQKPGVCDKCGGDLYQRSDDSESTVRERLEVYERQTAPLIDYYGKRHLLVRVKGEGTVEENFRDVCKALHLT